MSDLSNLIFKSYGDVPQKISLVLGFVDYIMYPRTILKYVLVKYSSWKPNLFRCSFKLIIHIKHLLMAKCILSTAMPFLTKMATKYLSN